jgi:GNAT superfamily N-acetyltransferase
VIEVREYESTDHDGVIALFRGNVPTYFDPFEEPFLVETLACPDGPLFVVTDSNEVVGFGGYETSKYYSSSTLIWGMVHADRHRQGFGLRLLCHRIAHMAAAPDRPRWVTVDTSPQMVGFFIRCGFEIVATWPGGYRSGFDRVDLRMQLTDEAIRTMTSTT